MECPSPNALPSTSPVHSSGAQTSFQAVPDDRAKSRRGNHLRQIRKMEGFAKSHLWENESKIWPWGMKVRGENGAQPKLVIVSFK